MTNIKLYIANASQYFTNDEILTINKAAEAAEKYIAANTNFDYQLDIIVSMPSYLDGTIPEDGIGGHTYDSRYISIVLNKEECLVNEDFVFETTCHELSHSLRWEKTREHTKSLFDTIIMEGLAVNLEERAMKDSDRKNTQYFLREVQKTTLVDIEKMMQLLADKLDNQDYNYLRIFITGDENLPRWSGYKLGYFLVKKYLEKTGRNIFQANFDSYQAIRFEVERLLTK